MQNAAELLIKKELQSAFAPIKRDLNVITWQLFAAMVGVVALVIKAFFL
jgi:hypothetical protein